MKKFFLKIVLCATAVLTGFGLFAPVTASANEGVESAVESVVTGEMDNVSDETETVENDGNLVGETETSEWFDETIKPLLLQYGAEVLAFATVVFLWLKKFSQSNTALGVAVDALTKSNGENIDTSKAVQELKEAFTKDVTAMKEEHAKEIAEMRSAFTEEIAEMQGAFAEEIAERRSAFTEEIAEMQGAFAKAVQELKETLADKVTNADDTLHKLLEVEKLAYGDNAALVSNGTAKKIAEVVGNGKKKNVDKK